MVRREPPYDPTELINAVWDTFEQKTEEFGALHNRPARAAVYLRANQYAEDDHLREQEQACRAYIANTPWTLDDAHVFADTLWSGLDSAYGPAFQRMRRAMRDHAFDVLVVSAIDCISLDHKSIDEFIDDAEATRTMIVTIN